MVEADASMAVGLFSGLSISGLSNPSPLRLVELFSVRNSSTVFGDKILSFPYVPLFSHIWHSLAKSLALEKSPALPCTPPKKHAVSSWTYPISCCRSFACLRVRRCFAANICPSQCRWRFRQSLSIRRNSGSYISIVWRGVICTR